MALQIPDHPHIFVVDAVSELNTQWHEGSIAFAKDTATSYVLSDGVWNSGLSGSYAQTDGGPFTTFTTYTAYNTLESSTPPLLIKNYKDGYGMKIENYCNEPIDGTGAGMQVLVKGDNYSNGIYVVLESTSATQFGINIDQNSSAGYGIQIYNIGAGTGMNISNWDENSTGVGITILNNQVKPVAQGGDPTAPAAYKGMTINNVIATGGYGIRIVNEDHSTGGTGIEIVNGDSGTGESVGLYIGNDSANYGLKIEHTAGDAGAYITGTTTTSPLIVYQNGSTAPAVSITSTGGNDINGTSSSWYVDKAGNALFNSIYVVGNGSFGSHSDRTPIFEGNALEEIVKIKGKDGKIDHDVMPEFIKHVRDDGTIERNIGNTITLLVKAVQELSDEVKKLKEKPNA